ncbi:MAG: hypothetical protein KME17_08040 [Cyanosarcina radialis HA8281-LM2]|jgi:hypothetical protein|nr:hypothetical protein [Cyanosarcina radialis HA8281-LM2]
MTITKGTLVRVGKIEKAEVLIPHGKGDRTGQTQIQYGDSNRKKWVETSKVEAICSPSEPSDGLNGASQSKSTLMELDSGERIGSPQANRTTTPSTQTFEEEGVRERGGEGEGKMKIAPLDNSLLSSGESSDSSLTAIPNPKSKIQNLKWVDPNQIVTDAGTQPRAWEDESKIEEYAERMASNDRHLWDFQRPPLPVVFLGDDGQLYAACHHRTKAARKAACLLLVEVRRASLPEIVIFNCAENTDHGVPLRPADQRRRIEMFLDSRERLPLDDERRIWSSRKIAEFLKLPASGYRTICNIINEREFVVKISQSGITKGSRVKVRGQLGTICNINPKVPGVQVAYDDPAGRDRLSSWIALEEVEVLENSELGVFPAETLRERNSEFGVPISELATESSELQNHNSEFSSVGEELKQLEDRFGLHLKNGQLLPDIDRNQGPPDTLAEERPFATPPATVSNEWTIGFLNHCENFTDEQVLAIWERLKNRLPFQEVMQRAIAVLEVHANDAAVAIAEEIRALLDKTTVMASAFPDDEKTSAIESRRSTSLITEAD